MSRVEELMKLIADQQKQIVGYENEIIDLTKEMEKAGKKADFIKIKRITRDIEFCFEKIASRKEFLERMDIELTNAERSETGFGPIVEFLEDMYQKDLEWHEWLKNDYKEKGYKAYIEMIHKGETTKTNLDFAKMSKEEAAKLFRNDVNVRYAKLVSKIESKVGNVKEFQLKRNANQGLDGTVTGDKGSVTLQTIVAGGYNIQRAHYRTLIK
jgi:hypothetical protein